MVEVIKVSETYTGEGDTMADIIQVHIDTVLDIPVDRVLDAVRGKLKTVVVIGCDQDDQPYYASSFSDKAQILWLLKCCEMELME